MKKNLIFLTFVLLVLGTNAQTKTHKFNFSAGGSIQHYKGNLGNSFFKFKTCCFAGVATNLSMYLNKSFDVNLGGSIGHFGYCGKQTDAQRMAEQKQKCPGCNNSFGMIELRSLMASGNISIKYKFTKGLLLNEDSKLAPYIYAGIGVNRLSDVMKRNCVNVGYHFSINAGAGLKYNITDRLNIGYNLAVGCFTSKKVYNAIETSTTNKDDLRLEGIKDFYMQNSIVLGINF